MSGSIVAFTGMALGGRELKGLHDTFEIMTARSLVGLVVLLCVAFATGRLGEIKTDRLGQHALRNICHFTGQNLWFWALTVIPLAQVFALEFTMPLWVILLATVFLGERLTRLRVVAAALGFAGILIVARPDFAALDPGVLAAATSAVFFALTTIFTKALTRHESPISILFWLALMQLCFGIVTAGYDGNVAWPTLATAPWLILIGLCGLLAHFCIATALSLAPASTVVPVDFARLPVIALVAWWAYGEAVEPTLYLGAALIFAGILLNLRAARHAPLPQPAA